MRKMAKAIPFLKAAFIVSILAMSLFLSINSIEVADAQTIRYTITASADANSNISPSGAVSVNAGGSRSFTFSAKTGYTLSRVTVNGTSVSLISPYTFTNVQLTI